MPTWTSQASDTFDRADENPLGNSVWSTITSETAMSIITNVARASNEANDCGSFYSGRSWLGDQGSRAVFPTFPSTGEQGCALDVRVASGARTYYRVVIDGGGTNNITIRRFVAGASTSLATLTSGVANGDTFEVRVSGPTNNALIEVLRNGSSVGSTTDTAGTVPASGSPGIGYSSTATGASLNNWEGLELVPDADPGKTGQKLPLFTGRRGP